ncbi:GntR family transcriptional regulator [Desulfofustis glycolicus]|uniref:Transcriptional regulator, GntR family n=1 Tax=Desulfofustis glycolicus DSM 9705 TaxID=1121409 RepID=A0A1M5W5X3_9BACT|nr:GntR family transcriptional regulator [Desulfofustis glycolicus]MCB2217250.1 GntR family transcriptional regulator [Desulfobulbaceae bacterium]SHH82584.1 transcriptional regulator, GntR family [Desulfofustis glycolicus DSM 9705]
MELKRHTYADPIVSYIKKGILNGTYKPGDKVKELDISKKLSISRAPVREALQVLIKEGLVVWIPQKGKFITKLNPKQVKDSYFTGGVLEAAAVSRALQLFTEKDISKLTELTEKMKEIADGKESANKIAELDDKFHQILFSRVDNDFVVEFCRRSCQGLSKFLFFKYWINMYTPHEVYLRHKVIVEAIKKGDATALEKQIRSHYFDAGERMSILSANEE